MSCSCGCGGDCGGARTNRPRLPAIAYRAGTHGSFLATMLTRLSTPELAPLAARTADDPAIGLLDAWAAVGDVLSFYEERIANEGYLRTATERGSIEAAARLVGYELRPGVAASTFLAYTLDKDLKGDDTDIVIPRGSRAQSVPEQNELPQPFETDEDVPANSAYNNLAPRLWRPITIDPCDAGALTALYLRGTVTDIKPGDAILLSAGGEQVPLKVAGVRLEQIMPDPPGAPLERTILDLQQPLGESVDDVRAEIGVRAGDYAANLDAYALEPLRVLDGLTAAELDNAVDRSLARLGDAFALADVRGARALADRHAGAIESLTRLRARLARVAGLRPAAPDLSAVLDALGGRTPAPPRPARIAARALPDPRLRKLAGARVAASATTLDAASALRVKASPFGATAPLRPVFDAKGTVIGNEEWPLSDATRLAMRWLVDFSPQYELVSAAAATATGPGAPELTLTADVPGAEHSMTELATACSQKDVQLRPGKVDLERDGGSLRVKFHSGLPPLWVKLTMNNFRVDVTLSHDANRIWRPDVGELVTTLLDDRRITVSLTQVQGDYWRRIVTVVEERLEAPDPPTIIDLDARYDQIVPDSWVLLEWGDGSRAPLVRRVVETGTVARTAYNTSATVTRLWLSEPWLQRDDHLLSAVRSVTVHAQAAPLNLAPAPITDDVAGSEIPLARLYHGLEPGRWVIVEGERTDVPEVEGLLGAEAARVAGVEQSLEGTTLQLARPLAATYKRSTVKVWGNVVRATHGETHDEVLGSGDARRPWASYPLSRRPLTYRASSNALGAAAALEVRVDGVRWHQAEDVALLGPGDRRYVTRTNADGQVVVVFGDGRRGTRVPTGVENVRATYRTGAGRPGNVKARQISQLQTRPLGVSAVINPLPATGGADADTLAQARQNAPIGLKALERLVSGADYEDFARARAGIGKASARALSDGRRGVVHLTIAGAGDISIDPLSDLFLALRAALARWGDPSHPVEVAARELRVLVISAGVRIDPDHRWIDVEPQLRARLLDDFGFDRRELGQPVTLSEVLTSLQSVRGVLSVDVDVLTALPDTQSLQQIVPARLARLERTTHEIADGDTLTEIAAAHCLTAAELVRRNPGVELPLTAGDTLRVSEGLSPAQLLLLSPETLTLREVKL